MVHWTNREVLNRHPDEGIHSRDKRHSHCLNSVAAITLRAAKKVCTLAQIFGEDLFSLMSRRGVVGVKRRNERWT